MSCLYCNKGLHLCSDVAAEITIECTNTSCIASMHFDPATRLEDPALASDFDGMSTEDLKEGLAYWINMANFRGNQLLNLDHKRRENDQE